MRKLLIGQTIIYDIYTLARSNITVESKNLSYLYNPEMSVSIFLSGPLLIHIWFNRHYCFVFLLNLNSELFHVLIPFKPIKRDTTINTHWIRTKTSIDLPKEGRDMCVREREIERKRERATKLKTIHTS